MTAYPRSISSVPYTDAPNQLQTLDVWLPRPLEQSDPAHSIWIMQVPALSPLQRPLLTTPSYVHGGAWRDPTQSSTGIEPTLTHLASPAHAAPLAHIAGIASLNYTLSPYPSHATHPSDPADPGRNATHPQHIRDVARAVRFLQHEYGVRRWIAAGHSCGATLLLQLAAGIGLDDVNANADPPRPATGPEALVLTAGIYNVPLLLANHAPPACPAEIAAIYADIVAGAFGADSAAYRAVSPVAGKYGPAAWPEGRLVVLAHSYEDELVERAQRDVMCVVLDREGWAIVMEEGDDEGVLGKRGRVLEVRDLKGAHDFVWRDGEQLARLLGDAVLRLVE
jgi:kynurenine formamidase